ncbi:MAG: HAD family phosphatase [Acidobacteriota bacterium]|nr:HAD family phosphatase [Acidobacteriota bacterium]MDE3139494.1 HAD family phosphatase [Acidobacteriota bacterium]
MSERAIRLLISDVDGTLVTPDKELTEDSIRAVARLREAGIAFAITSARPPAGLVQFVAPLDLTTPLAAFNGGAIVDADLTVIEEKVVPDDAVAPTIELLSAHDLSVWVYQGTDWFVLDRQGEHVDREAWICGCEPTVLEDFSGVHGGVLKIVGVSDDPSAGAAALTAITGELGQRIAATRSQTYFLDVTHPDANKGQVVTYLSQRYGIEPARIATIGDMHNDVAMFEAAGLSIAMGNADDAVQRAAHHVTTSNVEEGFANAVNEFILNGL